MERQKDEVKEASKELKEKAEKEIETLRKELERLRKLKKQKEKKKEQGEKVDSVTQEEEQIIQESSELSSAGDIENRLDDIEKLLSKELKALSTQYSEYIESQLQVLEQEIVGEAGLIEKELSPYEKLKNDYPWIEEARYEFMYTVPNKKQNPTDYESWKEEWGKVLFDYARYAVLHILYLKQMHAEKPFSNFQNRQEAIKEIVDHLVDQDLAKWLSKKKDKFRIYWKALDLWADEIYEWAYELGKLEPILIYEIREAEREFSNLPKEDIEEVFKMLSKDQRAVVIKTDDGSLALKIQIE